MATVDCRVVTARSGRGALKCLLAQDFAVILLDVRMPELDGFETATLIRARRRSAATPIIFMTAFDPAGAQSQEGYRLGAIDYIYKPIDPHILRSKVSVFVDLSRQAAELAALAADLAVARAEADLRHQALHDNLTGLPNRVQLNARLDKIVGGSLADEAPCALLLLDLNRFKDVNDTLGHQVGDNLLKQIGERLKCAARATDLVARLGGDEFAVLLPETDAPGALQVAQNLSRLLEAPFRLDTQSIDVDASIGIAVAPEHAQDADTLLRRADIAMYHAKRSGIGVAMYSPAEDQHRPDRLALLSELRLGIARDELLLHYQPKLDLRNGKLVGVEALVRWRHPHRGFLPPSEFIPLAEQSGLINPLSVWVLEAALRQQQVWHGIGLDIPVAVNLSRHMLQDSRLPATVAELLKRWDVPAVSLLLEITESSLMADPVQAGENLKQLRRLGVRMSIDDFGTGYSSLASLQDLSVDELKIDQSFVQGMATDPSSRSIVRAIIDLADALKVQVVAEGIEDRATWDVLVGLGCDVAQGYLLSPPLAAAGLEAWMADVGPTWLAIAESPHMKDTLRERIRGRGARLAAEEEFMARKQAEAALRASEERNRLALQAAAMGTWDWDIVQNVRSWSPETEALHGLASGTFEGTWAHLQRLIHPDDLSAYETAIRAAKLEVRESLITYRTIWPDGSLHWIEVKCRALFATDGTLLHLTGTSVDITNRKLVEEALRASEERNRLALQAAQMGTWEWDPLDGVQTWSTETQALHGLAPGTFAGTFEALRQSMHPDDWPAFVTELHASQDEHRDSITTYRTVWPDGTVRWLENKGRAVYAADGMLVRGTGTSMDITDRKLAEEALRSSEERFRRQYKGFPLPTCSWLQVGDEFVLQEFNDASETITGGYIRTWVGQTATACYAHQPEVVLDLRACVAEQRTITREMRYRYRATETVRDLAVTCVFVPPQTVMLHTEDITERKQSERNREAMAQSEKLRALGQMASGIAHDLNQSLMLVASYGALAHEALIENPPNLAEIDDLITTTTQAALDGGETVKRLLLFTRAAPEKDSQLVDLGKVVRDAAQLTAPRWRDAAQAEGRPIRLDVEAEGHPIIQGSPSQIRELMTNVIFNAVDALPTGGAIRLSVMAEDGQGTIEVTDTGVGMSAELQARVFEPFFTTKGESGTGLGLAMVFGIVAQHRGQIGLRSAPGAGTTVRITFPLVDAAAAAMVPLRAPDQLAAPNPLRVLAVDDEPMMTRAVVRMLKPSGHTVTVAASGEEALEKLAEQTFDVVVSDLGMGAGMNGWDLAAAVRTRWPNVRFMLATGWGAAIDPGEARANGVEAVLSKPYQLADLTRALGRTDQAA